MEILQLDIDEIDEDYRDYVTDVIKDYLANYKSDQNGQRCSSYAEALTKQNTICKLPTREILDLAVLLVTDENDEIKIDNLKEFSSLSKEDQYNIIKYQQDYYYSLTTPPHQFLTNISTHLDGMIYHKDNFYLSNEQKSYKLPYLKGKFIDDECAICCEEFEEKNLIIQLRCKHAFHIRCIDAWNKLKTSCPICRQQVIPTLDYRYAIGIKHKGAGNSVINIYLVTEPRYR